MTSWEWEIGLVSGAKSILKPRSAGTSLRQNPDNTEGVDLFRTFSANQILSTFTRGAIQMGYSREAFNPKAYYDKDQDTKVTH